MRLFISYCHDMTLSAGCSIDDRDSGVFLPNDQFHNFLLPLLGVKDQD